jgi:peptidoglycan hydrolase CwlO-like protein
MDTDLERLISNASSCSLSLKGAADAFVTALRSMKDRSLKCEADLKAKQQAADEQIAQLRADIQSLSEQRRDATRALEITQNEIRKTQKEITRLKEEYRATVDRILEPAA